MFKEFNSIRPGIASKFFWNWHYQPMSVYWWTLGPSGLKQRIKFLQHWIKKIENEK